MLYQNELKLNQPSIVHDLEKSFLENTLINETHIMNSLDLTKKLIYKISGLFGSM